MGNTCSMFGSEYLVLWLTESCTLFCSHSQQEVEFISHPLNSGLPMTCFILYNSGEVTLCKCSGLHRFSATNFSFPFLDAAP